MTTPTPVSFLAKIISISTIAAVVLSISSCTSPLTEHPPTDFGVSAGTSPATQEFKDRNGFKPSDYYGAYGSNDYVPGKTPKRY